MASTCLRGDLRQYVARLRSELALYFFHKIMMENRVKALLPSEALEDPRYIAKAGELEQIQRIEAEIERGKALESQVRAIIEGP
jgi:hypothetical protein